MEVINEKPAVDAAGLGGTGNTFLVAHSTQKKPRAKSKDEAMLRAFLEVGAAGLNCAEAAYHYHDLCLHSSISRFGKYYGLTFARRWEKFGRFDSDCVRYLLEPAEIAKVETMLGLEV